MKKIILFIIFLLVFAISRSLFSQIPNIRVTNNCWYQNEPMVAINPTNSNKMVCGYNDSRSGSFKVGWSYSDDGGLNWNDGSNFTFAGYTHGADPVVAYDNTGTAYFVGLTFNFDNSYRVGKDGSVFIAKSNDGGHTFTTFQKIIATGSVFTNHLDKPWLFINPINNHIYIAWVNRAHAWAEKRGDPNPEECTIWFTRSTDGGQNFSTPIQVSTFSPATGTNRSHGPQITATSANHVYVSWHTLEAGTLPNSPTTPWKIWISESIDGGANFGTNCLVQNTVWGYPNLFISMAADPISGKIYISYSDSHIQSPRDYDIFVTSATTASGPWSTPVKVNDDPPGTGRWQGYPTLNVAPNGRIDVMWYDYRDNPNGVGVYFSSSSDGGSTWSSNVRVTDLATGFKPSSDFAGDYNCVASLNEKAQLVWMDNRNTCQYPPSPAFNDQEIYTATVIIPTENICFPPHRGVPYSPNPPVIDGKVQEDVGWRGAYRIIYGNGTNTPHVACQALKHNSDNYIYLSFEVRNDPAFDNNDVIVLNFRPDVTNGSFINDRKIVIYPICDDIGAGGQTCSITTPDDKINQLPRQMEFYKNSAGWVLIPAGQIANVEAKVRSYSDGGTKAWNVELKLPISISSGGNQWVNFKDEFLFYFNVFRVSGTDGTVSEFRWPTNSPEVNSANINGYPFYPWEWGKADKSNTATCNGVSLNNYSDIGTSNTPSSSIVYTTPTNTLTNKFYANVRNNTEVGGVPQSAEDVFARFRIANWGIPGPGDWTDIPASNPACPNLLSNPTCPMDIPAGTSASPGITTFNLDWKISDSEIPNYQASPHQCILVELDSRSNTKITTKSIFRNMDFVQASLFIRSAEISAKGYGHIPAGFSDQQFALHVVTKEYAYGGGISFDTLKLKNLLPINLMDEKKPVSVLNYTVHGYRYTGRFIIINEKKYAIIDPVGSFGYVVSHKGLVEEWKNKITGCELIQPNLYRLNIPSEEKATVITEIEPVDYLKKWSLSLHTGFAIPTGSFANGYNPGFNLLLDADYHFSTQLSLVTLFGYNDFRSKSISIDDTYWINLSANLRYYQPVCGPWSIYLGGGPGLYISKNGSTELGANLGFGLDYDYNSLINFEMGVDYNLLFNQDFRFMHSHVGVVFQF
jgi:hypothetical protein